MPYDHDNYRENRGEGRPFRTDRPPRTGAPRRAVPQAVRDDGPDHSNSRRPENRKYRSDFNGNRPEKRDFRPDFDRHRPENGGFERKYDNRRREPRNFETAFEKRPQPERRPYEVPAAPHPAPLVEEQENLLVGRNPIREAIKAGREIEKLLVQRGELSGSAREIVAKAREARIIVQEVDKARLDAIYPNHQGMVAYASGASYAELDDIFQTASERGEDPFVLVLDGITDPHNLGAIIRTAECVGAHGIVIPERRSVGLTPAAVKASAGACEYMNVVRVTNVNRTLETLKERGLWIVGTTMDGEDALKADLTGPLALVIGAEGEGIAELTLRHCDLKLSLPMKGRIDSLNASVAAGVMMYAVMNARRG